MNYVKNFGECLKKLSHGKNVSSQEISTERELAKSNMLIHIQTLRDLLEQNYDFNTYLHITAFIRSDFINTSQMQPVAKYRY